MPSSPHAREPGRTRSSAGTEAALSSAPSACWERCPRARLRHRHGDRRRILVTSSRVIGRDSSLYWGAGLRLSEAETVRRRLLRGGFPAGLAAHGAPVEIEGLAHPPRAEVELPRALRPAGSARSRRAAARLFDRRFVDSNAAGRGDSRDRADPAPHSARDAGGVLLLAALGTRLARATREDHGARRRNATDGGGRRRPGRQEFLGLAELAALAKRSIAWRYAGSAEGRGSSCCAKRLVDGIIETSPLRRRLSNQAGRVCCSPAAWRRSCWRWRRATASPNASDAARAPPAPPAK